MAAVEIWTEERLEEPWANEAPVLRLVSTPTLTGRPLAQRRAARARMLRRRRRTLAALVLSVAITVLAWPGHAFGGQTGTGLPTDLATSAVLASGEAYVVQAHDTVDTLARAINPLDPAAARAALVAELGSSVVVPGERLVIP
jgi:hypothetical protein